MRGPWMVRGRVVALLGLLLASGCFWRMPGGTPDRQGANAFETTISPSNVVGLSLAWSSATDGGPVGDPVTSLAGVHVTDPHAAYGFVSWDQGMDACRRVLRRGAERASRGGLEPALEGVAALAISIGAYSTLEYGWILFAVLLFQDIAIVPMMMNDKLVAYKVK